jgi:hypothetical protein
MVLRGLTMGEPWTADDRRQAGILEKLWEFMMFMEVLKRAKTEMFDDVCSLLIDISWLSLVDDNKNYVQTMGLLPTHWRHNERPAHHLGRPQNGQVNKNKKRAEWKQKGSLGTRHPLWDIGQAATLAADSCHLEHISWPNPSQPRHPLSQKPLCSRNPSPRKSAVATTFETPSLE